MGPLEFIIQFKRLFIDKPRFPGWTQHEMLYLLSTADVLTCLQLRNELIRRHRRYRKALINVIAAKSEARGESYEEFEKKILAVKSGRYPSRKQPMDADTDNPGAKP